MELQKGKIVFLIEMQYTEITNTERQLGIFSPEVLKIPGILKQSSVFFLYQSKICGCV